MLKWVVKGYTVVQAVVAAFTGFKPNGDGCLTEVVSKPDIN